MLSVFSGIDLSTEQNDHRLSIPSNFVVMGNVLALGARLWKTCLFMLLELRLTTMGVHGTRLSTRTYER